MLDFSPDPDCTSPQGTSEGGPDQCHDGIDNDGDGRLNTAPLAPAIADAACLDGFSFEALKPACSDGEGKIDYTPPAAGTADPQCTSPYDNSEAT